MYGAVLLYLIYTICEATTSIWHVIGLVFEKWGQAQILGAWPPMRLHRNATATQRLSFKPTSECLVYKHAK